MDTFPFLSVIVPAYNEEKRIRATLEDIIDFLLKKDWQSEIIVVSDGSKDNTVKICSSLISKFPQLRIIEYAKNRGKGYAVKKGMLNSKGKLRLFMDADNATKIEEVEKLLKYIKNDDSNGSIKEGKFDIVIGSLNVAGAKIDKKELFIRALSGKMGNLIIRLFLLSGIYDTQRGFKLFTNESSEKIFSKLLIDRWGFDIEVLALANKFNFSVKETPICWSHNEGSKVGIFSYFQVLFELFKIRWWLWTKYKD